MYGESNTGTLHDAEQIYGHVSEKNPDPKAICYATLESGKKVVIRHAAIPMDQCRSTTANGLICFAQYSFRSFCHVYGMMMKEESLRHKLSAVFCANVINCKECYGGNFWNFVVLLLIFLFISLDLQVYVANSSLETCDDATSNLNWNPLFYGQSILVTSPEFVFCLSLTNYRDPMHNLSARKFVFLAEQFQFDNTDMIYKGFQNSHSYYFTIEQRIYYRKLSFYRQKPYNFFWIVCKFRIW